MSPLLVGQGVVGAFLSQIGLFERRHRFHDIFKVGTRDGDWSGIERYGSILVSGVSENQTLGSV